MPSGHLAVPTCLTLEPIPDESLIGYVFRLAAYRALPTARRQFLDCGFDFPTNQPEPEALAALARSASVPPERLEAISYGPPDRVSARVLGHRVGQGVLERRGAAERRVCPACLSERPYHRAMWDLRYVAVCPVHRCLLEDTCRHCGDALMWRGVDLALCSSNHRLDLRGMEPQPVDDGDVEPTAAVYGLFGDRRFREEADRLGEFAALSDLEPADAAEFLFRLGLERMGRRRKIFSSEDPGELAWQAHVALRHGVEALARWPDGFWACLDDMRERWGSAPGLSLRMSTKAIERWVAGLPAGNGRRILQAVQTYHADAVATIAEGAAAKRHGIGRPTRKPRKR